MRKKIYQAALYKTIGVARGFMENKWCTSPKSDQNVLSTHFTPKYFHPLWNGWREIFSSGIIAQRNSILLQSQYVAEVLFLEMHFACSHLGIPSKMSGLTVKSKYSQAERERKVLRSPCLFVAFLDSFSHELLRSWMPCNLQPASQKTKND